MTTTVATRPTLITLSLARLRIEITSFFRERDAVVFIFSYPLIMLGIFASVFANNPQGDAGASVPFAQYFLPGILATGIMLTSFQSLAIFIATERDSGGLKRLRSTPLPPVAYFAGKVLFVLVLGVVQAALLIGLAAVAFDVPLPGLSGWLTFAWVFLLSTATGAICGVAFSSVPRSGRSASAVVTPVVLILQFTSGVFFPFYELPDWMQTLSSVFPLKWMAQGMRSVFLPDSFASLETSGTWQHALTAGVLVLWLAIGLVMALRTFRWRRRDDG